MISLDDVVGLLLEHGDEPYGEAVTLLEHSLQSATQCEVTGGTPQLIVAALFHDVGHAMTVDVDRRIDDDHHELFAARLLHDLFRDDVARPVALHVAAKRFLCAREPGYLAQLSSASLSSLILQGGVMTSDECAAFVSDPHHSAAVNLRRIDDVAKVPHATTPTLEHFLQYCHAIT